MNPLTKFMSRNNASLKEGLSIIRKIIKERPNSYTTSELYKLALKETPSSSFSPPEPSTTRYTLNGIVARKSAPIPHPEHPIHSKTFLKKVILPVLEGSRELKSVAISRSAEESLSSTALKGKKALRAIWVWKPIAPERRHIHVAKPAEVVVKEDWSHLNKRRQRARARKMHLVKAALKAAKTDYPPSV